MCDAASAKVVGLELEGACITCRYFVCYLINTRLEPEPIPFGIRGLTLELVIAEEDHTFPFSLRNLLEHSCGSIPCDHQTSFCFANEQSHSALAVGQEFYVLPA